MFKIITKILTAYATSASFSSGSISFFDNEAAWLTNSGATASDVSSQNYDGATGDVDGSYTTSGGTGGAVSQFF